ncbi:MAG: radical SAM protein [Thermodesulfobacteriota bacterium]
MDYVGDIIRPPAEADSILLQVTVGCSHNTCAFCPAYKGKTFAFKDLAQVRADLEWAAARLGDNRRLFLCDGDALVMPQERLKEILWAIREKLPQVARVSTYANAKSLSRKTPDELRELAALGLHTLHMGLESGHDSTLARMNKWGDSAAMLREARKAMGAGLKLAVTVLLGLGGVEHSQEHAAATGRILAEMAPHQAAALTLMVVPGTPLWDEQQAGRFTLPDSRGMLAELRTLLTHAAMPRGLFLANHASNYLPLKLRMPRDREAALRLLDDALSGKVGLRPEWSRGL